MKKGLYRLGAFLAIALYFLTLPVSAENPNSHEAVIKVLATVPKKYAKTFTPFFFPRNKKAAYAVQDKDEGFVIFGGREGRHFTRVGSLSAQKTTLTYEAYDVN